MPRGDGVLEKVYDAYNPNNQQLLPTSQEGTQYLKEVGRFFIHQLF